MEWPGKAEEEGIKTNNVELSALYRVCPFYEELVILRQTPSPTQQAHLSLARPARAALYSVVLLKVGVFIKDTMDEG